MTLPTHSSERELPKVSHMASWLSTNTISSTSPESDLPGYEASASESRGNEDVVVEVEAQVNQKGKQVANGEHVGSTRHHVLVEKLSKEDAAQITCEFHSRLHT
jgi:hypothetical protein